MPVIAQRTRGRITFRVSLLAALLMAVGGQPAMAEDIQRADMDALMATCQADRQREIEPLRQEAIDKCIADGRGDREYCERYNRNFGERTSGGAQRGLFWHLPSCEKAVAAERFFRMNPARDVFSYQ